MKGMDFAFDHKNGDLKKGAPKVNEDGQILYRYPDGTVRLEAGQNAKEICDLTLVRGKRSVMQVIHNRLLTDNPDWFHHPHMGSNLSDLVGEPNTRDTALLGARYIEEALTYKGFMSPANFGIRPVPISNNEILYLLTINLPNEEEFKLPLVFDVQRGLKEVDWPYEEE